MTYRSPLSDFIADVDAIRRRPATPVQIGDAVASRLTALVADGSWLQARYRMPAEDRYQQHVLHVADDGGFSVVSLVWKPGQKTPIHDHVSWCVVGILEGVERERRYWLHEADGERYLVHRFDRIAKPGETSAIVPPDEDIHQVNNAGDDLAISIHVYGADIAKLGTSINHRFDDLPIREKADGRQVSWRSASLPIA